MDLQESGATTIQLDGGTLRLEGNLEPGDEAPVAAQLRLLADADCPSLVIDLSGVERVSSSYVRDIALAIIAAKKKGKSVALKASARVARLLRMGGLDKLGTIEVVEGGGGHPGTES